MEAEFHYAERWSDLKAQWGLFASLGIELKPENANDILLDLFLVHNFGDW